MTGYMLPRIDRARVRVSPDGTTWYDLTTRTLDITVAKQKDGGTSTVDVTFANAPADGDNLSPLVTPLSHPAYFMAAAQVNSGGTQLPAKLLDIGNIIAIDGAYTTDGSEPTDANLYPVFYGVLGAQTKTGHDENGNRTVSVHALDYASGRLNAYYLNDTTGISPGAPEAVIQNVLDKALGAGAMTLYVPVASQGSVTQNGIDNLVQNTTAWQAIQSIAEQIGYDCRWLWQPSLGAWRLTFYQPSRSMSTPDYVVDITGTYVHHLDVTDSYLRNQCTVEYRDSTDGTRKTVTVQDTTGPYNVNSKVGVRAVYITEADTSIIDSAAEATTLAQTVVDDLSNLYAQVEIDLPFEPTTEIYKTLQATDAYISDTPQAYAIDSVEHRMVANEWTTTPKMSGEVSLRKDAWLQKHGAPGAKRPFRLGDYREQSVNMGTLAPDVTTAISSSGGITTYYGPSTSPPSSPKTGDLWIQSDKGGKTLRYDGTAWSQSAGITDLSNMSGTVDTSQIRDSAATTIKIAQNAISGLEVFETTLSNYFQTSSSSFVDSGASVTFTLSDPGDGANQTVLIYMTATVSMSYTSFSTGLAGLQGQYQLVLDGGAVDASVREFSLSAQTGGPDGFNKYDISMNRDIAFMKTLSLAPGSHTVDLQVLQFGGVSSVAVGNIVLGAQISKR